MAAPRRAPSKPELSPAARAMMAELDGHVTTIGDGLLRVDEEIGLKAALPKLAALASEMGVMDKAIIDWSPEEMMRFLALAVRAAMPISRITHHSADFNDRIPW